MKTEFKEKLKGILVIPIGLAIILVPFSMLIGWGLFTGVLFWFIITPGLAIFLPTKVSASKNHLLESLVGLSIFYAMMVFMIYKQYQTDYFKIMVLSLVINLFLVSILKWIRRPKTQGHLPRGSDSITPVIF